MRTKIAAALGFVLTALGLIFGGTILILTIPQLFRQAFEFWQHDDSLNSAMGPGPCEGFRTYVWFPHGVMSERESRTLQVVLINSSACAWPAQLAVYAPDFNVEPSNVEDLIVAAHSQRVQKWVVSPKRSGQFVIVIDAPFAARELSVNVTNVFGLSARTANLVAIIGAVCGPLLTIPYWVGVWKGWRSRQKQFAPQRAIGFHVGD